MKQALKEIDLAGQQQFRIIPSVYPAINFFEDLVDPAEMETLWEIESLTNDRLRQEAGDIFLVPPEDRIAGYGSSVVMAAFTHIGRPSRFTDGSYGVYYASLSLETAIRETVYHREQFMRATKEDACELMMRSYAGNIIKPFNDIRSPEFQDFHHPDHYHASQQFGKNLRAKKAWGIIYNSVRHAGGQCIAAFRPKAVSVPTVHSHLKYVWDGGNITSVFDTRLALQF